MSNRVKLLKDESIAVTGSTTPALLSGLLADGDFQSKTGIVTIHNCDASANAYVAWDYSTGGVSAMDKLTPDASISFDYGVGEFTGLYVAADVATVVIHVWQESA